jgi:hypothetical protein
MPHSNNHRQTKRSFVSTPIILAATAGAILILAGFLLLANSNSPTPSTGSTAALPDSHNEDGIPYPEVPRISPAEAKAAFEAGTALIVDVRSQGEFDTDRVSNAISLPLADLDARYRELPQDMEIITYCT